MPVDSIDSNVLRATAGYLVADSRGRIVGRVEQATASGENGAVGRLTVRGGLPMRRRRIVFTTEIDEVDTASEVVALSVERAMLRSAT
jgi:sporulation protein YlmC with PRC-barrel domain